jgi:receptor protein-tyrosine kinase
MRLNELLEVLWRRKLTVIVVALIVVAIAVAALRVVTPIYESTSTLALTPKEVNTNAIFVFSTMDAIVPVYADAATSRTTRDAAVERLGKGVAPISVRTFQGSSILKVTARSSDPVYARDSAQAVTDALLARANSGDIGVRALELSQLDRPAVESDPVFPNERLTYIVAALLGLSLGVGVALLRENLATKIETVDDLARVADAPSFGEIPNEGAVVAITAPEDLVTDPRLGIVSEALRDLRTNLLFSEGNLRSLVVTSPDGSHGKTTISFGLAVTLARAGTRTLLVDGDLRRGRVPEMLKIPRSPGLMEVLLGEKALEDVIRKTSMDTLDIITGGRRAGDPGELLTVEFPGILSQLEELYETVVVDSTPVVPVSDARVMARFADATVLVASAGHVTRRQVKTAVDRLNLISVRLTAVVLNNSRASTGSSYYTITEPGEKTATRRRVRAARR